MYENTWHVPGTLLSVSADGKPRPGLRARVLATGDSANDLFGIVLDPNMHLRESICAEARSTSCAASLPAQQRRID